MSREYISTSDAGRILGVTRHRIVQLLKAGVLDGFKLERQWVVSRSSVERLRERREQQTAK